MDSQHSGLARPYIILNQIYSVHSSSGLREHVASLREHVTSVGEHVASVGEHAHWREREEVIHTK